MSDPSALNQALVDELKSRGLIQSPGVEAAFRAVLRHHFLPGTPLEEVYSDRALVAKVDESGTWISSSSQPAIMAIMLEQLELQPGHRVLEIGAGTGYNAALMAHIVGETGQVVTIDIDEDLVDAAREHLAVAGSDRVRVVRADGGYGSPEAAPFDRIILTVGAPDITPAWREQLKPDGRLVLPLAFLGAMKSVAFGRVNDHLESISVKDCGFMPLRGDFAATQSNRVPLEPGLFLETADGSPVESDAVLNMLAGPRTDRATDVEVEAWRALGGELWTWLALREPGLCKLVAEGDKAGQDVVPALVRISGPQEYDSTVLLIGKSGLAALARSSNQLVPLVDRDKLFNPDSPFVLPFPLFVRQFGPDSSVAERLVKQVQAWEAAGRPSSEGMRIRAYPKNVEHAVLEGEFVIEKEWTRLVLAW